MSVAPEYCFVENPRRPSGSGTSRLFIATRIHSKGDISKILEKVREKYPDAEIRVSRTKRCLKKVIDALSNPYFYKDVILGGFVIMLVIFMAPLFIIFGAFKCIGWTLLQIAKITYICCTEG